MDSPALDELTRRVNGGGVRAAASLTLEASLNRIARRLDQQASDDREFSRNVQPILIPAQLFPVSGSALTVPPAAQLALGPEDGQVWDVRRISLDGWTSADTAINVSLYRETAAQGAGQSENFLQRFNGNIGNKTWLPGGGLLLRSPDTLTLGAPGTFTTTTGIIVSGEAIQVAADWLWKYLL